MTSDEAKDMQIRVLADRLALVVAECCNQEIESMLEGESGESQWWETMATMIVSDDDGSRFRQEQIRGSEFYQPALTQVRQFMRGILVSLKQKRRVA